MSEGERVDPVIITGVPRSGVRLMAAILDAHPRLASGPDLPFLITMALQWREIATTLGANHAKFHNLPPESVREAFRSAMLALFEPRLRREGKGRFVMQSFAAMLSLDVLAALFPAAHFVFMVRDPRAVAMSLQKCDWRNPANGARLPYTVNPTAGARLWTELMQAGLRSVPALERVGRLHIVRYEDLCTNPGATLKRLGDYLGEAAPAAGVTHASAACVVASADNQHPPLRTGVIDVDAVDGWRGTMRGDTLREVTACTFPLASRFGYG